MTHRLNNESLHTLPGTIAVPGYDRRGVATGIVHIGAGAFHRSHQAWFIENALKRDPRWGICAVSLRSNGVRDALIGQDNLYALAIRDDEIWYQVIGALRELLVAPEDPQAVLERMCAPSTHIVTITVTEKGYCLSGDGSLDVSHPDIRHDLQTPHAPVSVIGFITEALQRRKQAREAPFAVVSCDNLADNGLRLAQATVQFARERDASLAAWIEQEVFFPRTMVDSITPATTAELKRSVEQATGLEDRGPVQREAFVQWVIQRGFRGATPDWESLGVTLTHDVSGYEQAKLRLLNGGHSTLAYAGLLSGYRTVGEAMRDDRLRGMVERLMTDDILPTLRPPAGLDLHVYVQAILRRFRNPNMHHALAQIAMDGTQKLPIRILGTVRDALASGRSIDRLCAPLAAWMHFVRRAASRGETLSDPLASQLAQIGRACTGHAAADVSHFLELDTMFPTDLRNEPRFTQPLVRAYEQGNAI